MSMVMDVFTCLSLFAVICIASAADLSRGFNEKINWVTLENGLKLAKEENKPLMLLIHKTWCGACKSLKPEFAESKGIEDLSKKFIMVNTEDDEEPTGPQYQPDGGYIPRILFLGSDGKVKKEVYNKQGHASYKYFYADPEHIVTSMNEVLDMTIETEKEPSEEL